MRTPFVAGNWKMYKTISEARNFVAELVPAIREIQGVDKVICPPFVHLLAVKALLEGSGVGLGAQNMHWEEQGAYTGEVSPAMLAELCDFVILGHSERRGYFCETDENVNKKVRAALSFGLTPIVCIGETLEENEAGKTGQILRDQIAQGFADIKLPDPEKLIIAYEPIWAIGTGKAATAEGANQIIADVIRPALQPLFGAAATDEIRVLYGGSVKANNAREFFAQPDIDGGLVGGACLKVDEFTKIIQAAI
jgi:triosephosphate isomerase